MFGNLIKKTHKTAFLESDSSTCSSVTNILDLEDQIPCCQRTFWNVNNCIQGIYIVNNDSLLHMISFRLIIMKMNLQLPFILYILSFDYNIFTKKITNLVCNLSVLSKTPWFLYL